jgi:O-antigen/teichoic acid export membrane protein
LCVALFSEELITLLTPVSYHGAIPIISILSMHFGFMFFSKIAGTQLIYSKKSYISSFLTFLSVGLNVGLNIPMIMKFGAVGAAWATMLAGIFSGTISILVAQHFYKIDYEWNKIVWIMGTFFIGTTVIASMNLLHVPYLWSLPVKIIVMVVFLVLGSKYRILSKNNFFIVKDAFFSRKLSPT